jgi:hypothetical protein
MVASIVRRQGSTDGVTKLSHLLISFNILHRDLIFGSGDTIPIALNVMAFISSSRSGHSGRAHTNSSLSRKSTSSQVFSPMPPCEWFTFLYNMYLYKVAHASCLC